MGNFTRLLATKGDVNVFNIPVLDINDAVVPLPSDLKIWFTAKSDLALADAAAEIKLGSPAAGSLTGAAVFNSPGGIIQVTVPAASTASLPDYVLEFDCQIEGTGIPRTTVDQGFLYLTDQVTLSS